MSGTEERVVPWLSRSEFFDVYNGLYSQNASEQRRAVDKVAVWRCRVFKQLPVAIDSTAVLVESLLKKQLNNKSCHKKYQHENKLALSVALIRFVNHIIEKGQTKQFAQSVHVLAEEIGLPEWLIDIRHNSTHGCLPSLSHLEEGVLWSLDWLNTEYWKKQTVEETPFSYLEDEDADLREYVAKLLEDYSQIQFELVFDADKGSNSSLKCILNEIENNFPKNKKMVVAILAQEGYLLFTKDQLNAFDVDCDSFMESNLNLSNIMLQFWKPVLKLIHQLKGTSLLLEILAKRLTTSISLENRLCAGWIFEIVSANERISVREGKKSLEKNLFSAFCELPVEQILQLCLHHPGGFSSLLIESLSEKVEFTTDFQKELSLWKIFSGQKKSTSCDAVVTDSFHTLKDLLNKTKASEHKAVKRCKEDSKHLEAGNKRRSPWKLCTDMNNWSDYPMGLLHGQELKSLRLELSLTSVSNMASSDTDSLECDVSSSLTYIDCSFEDTSMNKTSLLQTKNLSLIPVINIL